MEKASHRRFVKFSLIYSIVLSFPLFLNISYIYASKADSLSSDAEAYRTKGYEAQQRGDIDTAIEWYQKAANIMPEYASPHNDLGILFETKGWLDRAEAEYNKALAIDPNYKEVHTNLALLYERKGELEKAAFHWMKRYKLGSLDDPWTQEAKTRLEKLGLLDKTESTGLKLEQQIPAKEPQRKEKPIKKEAPVRKHVEKRQESPYKVKKSSEWARIGPEKKAREGLPRTEVQGSGVLGTEVKPSPAKTNKAFNADLQESLRLAEERLKKERADKQNTAAAEKQVEVKAAIASSSEVNAAYNKAKDYYNKGEYAKALDTIRLARQNSRDNKQLLGLEEDIKIKMKEERIEDYYKEGMIHYRQKDFAGARKEFEAILSILPE